MLERLFQFAGGRRDLVNLLLLGALLLVVMPLVLDSFRLNLAGKHLSFAFVAVGLVLCWGYGGILSLGQGIFFGLGGYLMAMFLKLESSGAELPDFMVWNSLESLPAFWQPFHSFGFTLLAIFVVPTLLAWLIGAAMFKRRVGGVYFAIITQALAWILSILFIGQQGLTGGINGITNFSTLLGWDLYSESAKLTLYYVNAALLIGVLLASRFILDSRLGKLLVAVRDKEDRVRFSGFDVSNFKIFVFCVAALFSAIGGAMFTLQVGLISPSLMGIVPSIEMVVFAAVGGRYSVIGAVYGTLLVSYGKTFLSENFPELWLYFIGALFIAVVMVFPNGLAGLVDNLRQRLRPRGRALPVTAVAEEARA